MSLFYWSPPRVEETIAGDQLTTRRARFRSQEDQIRYLREVVTAYRCLATIRARARDIVYRLENCEPRNDVASALAIARWTQANIRYVKELPEVFQTPSATISLGYGDCDDVATVIAALCESIGIETELVGLEWDAPPGSGVKRAFQHIYTRALARGMRIPLDATLQRPVDLMTDPIKIALERRLRLRVFLA